MKYLTTNGEYQIRMSWQWFYVWLNVYPISISTTSRVKWIQYAQNYHSTLLFLWIITCSRSRTVCSLSFASNCWYCRFLFICSINCFYFSIAATKSYFFLSRAAMYYFWTNGPNFWYNYRFIYLNISQILLNYVVFVCNRTFFYFAPVLFTQLPLLGDYVRINLIIDADCFLFVLSFFVLNLSFDPTNFLLKLFRIQVCRVG